MSKLINTKNKKMILGVILLVVLVGASYGIYSTYFVSGPEPEEPEPEPETLTVVDAVGNEVMLSLPVEKIVTLNSGLTEIICALGGEDKIIGRDEDSTFPESVSEVAVVAESSYSPNMEMILDLEPDLVIADTMLSYKAEELETFASAGIPVVLESPTDFTRLSEILTYFGEILDESETATEIIDFITYYEDSVCDCVEALTESEKPTVFIEWNTEWRSFAEDSVSHQILKKAGGTNIIADGTSEKSSPTLSAEFVAEANPDVIVRMAGSDVSNLTEFEALRNELLTRSGLTETTAVTENRVYLYDSLIFQGLRYPVGLLYWAKWFNPTLFEDVDPNAVHEELMQRFFDTNLEGIYAYPTETTEPTEPEPETITFVDSDDNEVTITLPVERIGCLNGGLAEVICALGGDDKIIARTDDVVYPTSMLDKPSVGVNAASAINLEVLVELNPDLVVASSALDDEIIENIRNLGIPVIIESTSDVDRMENIVTVFGQILDETEKAQQILDNNQYYTNMIQERLQNVTENEKTSFYYEFRRIWYSMTNQTNMGKVLDSCGGVNIASNSSVRYTTLSAEYVLEQNPEVIIYSLSGTTNVTDYEIALNDLVTRSELQDVDAIKNNRVHIFYYYLGAGIRYPVGELYFAKWFYPDLFADIDPNAVHEQLIQEYFGEELEGTYAYPAVITLVDALGNEVTITLPVERIVSLTGGLTEIVCALGGEDLLVGRGEYSTFPPSVIEIPVASSSSYSVNMETLLEFEPDLILADTMMKSKPEYIEQIQAAGIPLIVENTANVSRISPIIASLGVIVDNTETATELIEWMDTYVDLVYERTATLSESDMPSVYMEWTSSWKAIGPGHAIGQLMETAGGINVVTNASATTTTVSPEFVLTENPEIMFATTYSMPAPTEVSFYEDKMADVLSQTGLSSITAATDENIHLYSYRIIQGIRYPIGLLYFAKCMHPTLYEDIDPSAILDDMIDQFFGIELDAIYVYP